MRIDYKKSKDNRVFIALYGHIGFAAISNQPGSRKMTLGVVEDSELIELELDVCNRADFETFIEGINDPSGLTKMYRGLVKTLVKEHLKEVVEPE